MEDISGLFKAMYGNAVTYCKINKDVIGMNRITKTTPSEFNVIPSPPHTLTHLKTS